jgi:hypothetical protein
MPSGLRANGQGIRARPEKPRRSEEKLLRAEVSFSANSRRSLPLKQRILFICVHNSARTQMAEAWLNQVCGESANRARSDRKVIHKRAAAQRNNQGESL